MSQTLTQSQQATPVGMESFAALFEESLLKSDLRAGEVISAEVVRIEFNHVVVNAGLKSEAYVAIAEFKNDKGELEVEVGDFVSVAIDAIENGYGDTILSRDKAKRLASWLSLEVALDSGDFVTGTVSGKVKGGLTVLVNGIRAFLPGSLIDTRPVKDLSPYEGKTLEFKVIKLDRKRNNVVLSRRAVVEASMGEERAKLLETLTEGAIVHGVVKNRSALCWTKEIAALARQHNDANIISIPARFTSIQQAVEMVDTFINTNFEGGRHANRVNKIACQ